MAIRLRLTDHQLAVAERLRARTGAATFAQLAALAIDHELARPTDRRWSGRRPRRPSWAAKSRRDGLHFDAVLPGASGAALTLAPRQRLRLEQLKDGQCVDLSAFLADGRSLSAARTRAIEGLKPSVGASLWSTPPHRALLTITADTAPDHDLCFPPCSELEYLEFSGISGHLGCAELHAAARRNCPTATSPASDDVLNLWLPSAVHDDSLRSWPVACRRGDFVELEAQCEAVVVLSTCPDDLFGSSQYEPGPVRVTVTGGVSQNGQARRRLRLPSSTLVWPTAPPSSALARNEVAVEVSAGRLAHVDRIAARGWLGYGRAAVLRAVVLRLNEALADNPARPHRQPDF